MGAGSTAQVLRPKSDSGRVPFDPAGAEHRGMDFEPWLRDQLASSGPDEPPDALRRARPKLRLRIPAFRAGFAGAGVMIVALGLASGRALPTLQLTTPRANAQDLPVSTWAGVPSEPPGAAQLAAGRDSSGGRASTAVGGSAGSSGGAAVPVAGSDNGTSSGGGRPEDGGHNPAGSGQAPAPAPTPEDGGGRSPGGPSPAAPAASPSSGDGGHRGSSPSP